MNNQPHHYGIAIGLAAMTAASYQLDTVQLCAGLAIAAYGATKLYKLPQKYYATLTLTDGVRDMEVRIDDLQDLQSSSSVLEIQKYFELKKTPSPKSLVKLFEGTQKSHLGLKNRDSKIGLKNSD